MVSSALLVVPLGTSLTETASPGGGTAVTQHVSLLESEGVSVLAARAVPIAFPLLALITGHRAWVIGLGALYLLFALLAGFSIGLFYLPAALALFVGGFAMTPASRRAAT